jgi:hypothetical protein
MIEAKAVQVVRNHFEALFPKICSNCGRQFATLREYILITTRQGAPISFDADLGDWDTADPIGSAALANCSCGTTLALTTNGMALPQRLKLLDYVKRETQRRGVSPSELLEGMRNEIRRQVLGES